MAKMDCEKIQIRPVRSGARSVSGSSANSRERKLFNCLVLSKFVERRRGKGGAQGLVQAKGSRFLFSRPMMSAAPKM